ncbi:MAG: carboxypeptidase regulatory-like domain-containing protein, partial [Armatimonadota bacterium]
MAGARSVTWVVPVLGLLACADALSYAVTITGAVVDAQGEPVTDATILVSYKKPGTLALARAKADNEGRFTVEFEPSKDAVLPTWRVGAFSPRHALEWQDVADGQSCTLRLTRKPVPCRGVVVDEEGKGVPRAEVGVDWIMWGEGIANWFYVRGLPELTRTTDAEGRFEVPGVPPNSRLSLHVVAPGKATKQERFNSARPQVLRIQLAPEARIRGKLTHKGKPVGGVEVFCQAQGAGVGWDDATTDADGSYVLEHLPAGTYNVMVNPPEGLTAVAVEGVTVQAGDETTARDLELIEGGYVEGTVTEADTGEPTEGAHIGAYGPARPDSSAATQSVTSDAEG